MRNGEPHPKNYPFWNEVIEGINQPIVQVGVHGEPHLVPDVRHNLSLTELAKLVDECKTWIAIDSFFQHFCWDRKKKGIVLWGQSDPLIFGHPENINLLKSRDNLREKQFWLWEQTTFNAGHFVGPDVVLEHLNALLTELG